MIIHNNPYEKIFRLSQRGDQYGELAVDISHRWVTALFADNVAEMAAIEDEIKHVEFLIALDKNNG